MISEIERQGKHYIYKRPVHACVNGIVRVLFCIQHNLVMTALPPPITHTCTTKELVL